MIGPWTVNFTQVRDNVTTIVKKEFKALTILERATSWLEFAVARTFTVEHVSLLFDKGWLCRYPRPKMVVHDNGGEFNRFEFQEMISSYAIVAKPTTVKNRRANSAAERVHLTMSDMLRTQEFSGHDWFEVMDQLLQSVAWAIRVTVSTVTRYSPGQLAFGHDMIIQTKVIVEWGYLQDKCRKSSRIANERKNKSKIEKVFKKGDKVLIVLDRMDRGAKLNVKVYTNGTIKIKRKNYF